MGTIRALGYVGFTATNIDRWKDFAPGVLGLQLSETWPDGTLVLRADAYQRRIFIHPGRVDEIRYIGWEVYDADSLEKLKSQLTGKRVPFVDLNEDETAHRAVIDGLKFLDTDGLHIEAFYGASQSKHEPFVSPVGQGPFVTGEQGLGHIVVHPENYSAAVAFYKDVLDFKISDYCTINTLGARDGHATFMHVNPRHHSLALANFPIGQRLNHIMLELETIDDVGCAYERALAAGAHILLDLGRHTNDDVFSFYVMTPSGWSVEIGCGGRRIDDTTWHVSHHTRPSSWGHKFNMPTALDRSE
ncbi:TPA: VOC family protein [Burkholderia cepacia]|uniref:VOC family protein n=1 Tax=Burkholderia cepacia TaxID=292 RepID=UPI000D2F1882|nr:VOC family protein [Burkholderia cepacia]MCA8357605.1 VOC family protein [Burkholderia cepacia]HDV6368283.1 VOC family protein [Burkholderia cepacia]